MPSDAPFVLTELEASALASARERDDDVSPARRKREGIVHTPPQLARFVARAIDELLTSELGATRGLADPQVAVVDPACGPGAFLAAVAAVAAERVPAQRARLIGLDRDSDSLRRCRETFAAHNVPVELRCEDTLEQADPAALAGHAEHCVLLGNPPWIGSAQAAPGARLEVLLEELRRDEHGVRLAERKLGVLSDAYVRFFAFALAAARSVRGVAVLGFVTNASYLDGPVHRGLRGALARTFDRVQVIDWGGSALLAHATGSARVRDENVFGVRTPAAALLALRRPGGHQALAPGVRAQVSYSRLLGSADDKLEQLGAARLTELPAQPVACISPTYSLVPVRSAPAEYRGWPALCDLMPFHREGVQTNRDAVIVDADPERLSARLIAFAEGRADAALALAERSQAHYDPEHARRALNAALSAHGGDPRPLLRRLAYRPLDTRWFLPLAPLCHRPRAELLAAVDHASFSLVTVRKDRSAVPWRHVAAVVDAVDNSFLSVRSSCRARAVPTADPNGAENLDLHAASVLMERAGRRLSAHELALYVLARLSEPSYQARFEPWLRGDYPRVPLPCNAAEADRAIERGALLLQAWCGVELPPHSGGDESMLTVGHHRVLDRVKKGRRAPEVASSSPTRARARCLSALLALDLDAL